METKIYNFPLLVNIRDVSHEIIYNEFSDNLDPHNIM